ncbi:MAG: thiol reductase thioredoxin [Desulfobacteraceae bacterium 4572_88]|nr:MAG: thiol reductase thioredoxin [Desulfobacteraceae bacterium 4572_88]RLC19847.1 MAG: thioredoxin [Deltaproteobacteria bacterium]
MKKMMWIAMGLLLTSVLANFAIASSELPEIPVKGMVTMLDIGAKKCIPCKMMAPILEELEKEYKGKAAIIFIDVWQRENAPYSKRFGIRSIPTQIFFDKDGKEVGRHVGFMPKKNIVAMLEKLGVK